MLEIEHTRRNNQEACSESVRNMLDMLEPRETAIYIYIYIIGLILYMTPRSMHILIIYISEETSNNKQ